MKSPAPPRESRLDIVRRILNDAAGDSPADYGGQGRFWNQPLQDFLQASVHGIRMIAPAAIPDKKSCCAPDGGTPPAAASAMPRDRAARSGLIAALRGQPPFDSQTLPPLPWGGARVPDEDIQFIADWIDDDCPEQDRVLASTALSPASKSVRFEKVSPDFLAFAPRNRPEISFSPPPPPPGPASSGRKQRMNLDCLSPGQLDELRHAFRELYALNKWPEDRRNYNNLALIHQNHCQHGWERFLPWHRVYLYEFEQALQDICPGVTLPYWDWTMPQYRPENPAQGWIIPESFQALLTPASIAGLENTIPAFPKEAVKALRSLAGQRFVSPRKFFTAAAQLIGDAHVQGEYRKRLIDALLDSNPLWYPLRYPAEYSSQGAPSTINKVIHYHYPTARDMEDIQSLKTFRDYGGGSLYNDSFGFLDQNPHNTLHIWTGGMNPDAPKAPPVPANRNHGVKVAGRRFHTREDFYAAPAFGDMFSNLTASYDPIFWPIHSNVDRLWSEWQELNPNALPADLDAVLTPWSYTVRDTLNIHAFGYEYVKSAFLFPVGLETPISRFTSKSVDVPERVRNRFRQAEVRLNQIPQLPRSCFVRVFLNLPDATAQTDIAHPNYAGYAALFGHGPCYGGPGHCDLPPETSRKFDRRPRHHNTPRNLRIPVTNCARALFQKGDASLSVTLVVIGADYDEEKELLRLDHLTLTFLD